MGRSLRVKLRRFDLVNLVFLKLILLFQEDSDSSGGGSRPQRRLRPLLAVQAGPVEAEPEPAETLEPEPAEIDLAGAVVKVLCGPQWMFCTCFCFRKRWKNQERLLTSLR